MSLRPVVRLEKTAMDGKSIEWSKQMNKKEVQAIMAIARPAIIALYGRQALRLVRYNDALAYRGRPGEYVRL